MSGPEASTDGTRGPAEAERHDWQELMRPAVLALLVLAASCAADTSPRLRADGTVSPPPDVAAPPADAGRTPSGLAWKMLRVGFGQERPAARSLVVVIYTAWTTDGQMYESSLTTGRPATLDLSAVPAGLREGLLLMTRGEKRRLWVPPALAGTEGMLVFDVELLEIR
jgi:peptidylprolyl isomerase